MHARAFVASTTEYNKVAQGGQTSTTSYNTPENKRNVEMLYLFGRGLTQTHFHFPLSV